MAMNKTASQYAEKWSRRLQGSAIEIKEGVNAVTESPTSKAVAQQDKMRANLLAAIDSGKWARNTSAVTLQDWKDAMLNKGVDRITQGAATGKSAFQTYMAEAIPVYNSAIAEIEAMPSMNQTDSLAKVRVWMQRMQEFSDSR